MSGPEAGPELLDGRMTRRAPGARRRTRDRTAEERRADDDSRLLAEAFGDSVYAALPVAPLPPRTRALLARLLGRPVDEDVLALLLRALAFAGYVPFAETPQARASGVLIDDPEPRDATAAGAGGRARKARARRPGGPDPSDLGGG